jgi:hypothetical protein
MTLVHSFTYLYALQVWNHKQRKWDNFNDKDALQHYNTIMTSFVPYKNIIIYPQNKIFTIFTNYLLPILLITYYLAYIPTIYKLTYI